MRDINDIMPKIPNMRWGAVMNHIPSSKRIIEMDQAFRDDHKWHTVLEDKDAVVVDGKRIPKYHDERLT
jgi:hypothetical protein